MLRVMEEHERQLEVLRAAIGEHLDEYVVSAAWCVRAGKFGDGLRVFKALRRWTARRDHPADRARDTLKLASRAVDDARAT